MRGERERRFAVLAVALLVGASAGCGEPDAARFAGEDEAAVPEEERYGGTAVVGGLGDLSSLNPLVSTDALAAEIQRYALFAPLVRYDAELRPRPYLAESWELSPDSSSVVFRLRDGVRWHDGAPLTAEDVAFTFRRVKDPAVPYPNRSYFESWESVEVLDELTVRFELRPTAAFLYGWSRLPILPAHALGDVAPGDLETRPFGGSAPVGSGPFRFVEHAPGDRWVFEANPEFPEEMGGRPYLDRLVYRIVPEAGTLEAELRAGDVHLVLDMSPSGLERVREDPELRAESFVFPSYVFIAWNGRRPPFNDVRVRRAMTLALDREEIVSAVRRGLGTVASGPVGPWHWAHDSTWRPLPHDPDSARALLEAAGWRDEDGDGVREKDGEELRFELLTNPNPARRDAAVMAQADLSEVGVDARPNVREFASLLEAITGAERDFDAVLLSWTQFLAFDDRNQWACDRRDRPAHLTGYCDPSLDAVLDSIPRTLDRDERGRLLRRYHGMIQRAQPQTFLYFTRRLEGARRGLHGVDPDARGELVNVRGWWLSPGAR